MAKILFATGEVYEGEGCSVYEAAKATFGSVSREVLAALVNGEMSEIRAKAGWRAVKNSLLSWLSIRSRV